MNQSPRPYPQVVAYPPKLRRHRAVNPYTAANALAIQHQDIAGKVARNLSRRTGHPVEDLQQIAMMGVIQASRRYNSSRGDFRRFARVYANGEVYHFLRDKGFMIKLPSRWRELHARGKTLLRLGRPPESVAEELGVSKALWQKIQAACMHTVISLDAAHIEPASDQEQADLCTAD
jgi:DNA-directed RNA polymerase specialized sigma subunit